LLNIYKKYNIELYYYQKILGEIDILYDKELLKNVVRDPKEYLNCESRNLEERIDEIKLNSEQKKEIEMDVNKEILGESIKNGLSIVTGGMSDFLFEIASWKSTVDKNMNDAKKALLMADYLNKFDSIEQGLENLKRVVSDIYGQTLFSKIDNILEDNPLDEEIIKRLSNIMKNISESKNLELIFTSSKHVLNLVEKLSPLSLYMLGDYCNWPTFEMKSLVSVDDYVNAFESHFVEAYRNKNGNIEKTVIETAVSELSSSGLIVAQLIDKSNESNKIRVFLTSSGKFLYDSVSSE
jgi:hypothetical protein